MSDEILAFLLGLLVNEVFQISSWAATRLVRWAAYHRYTSPARALMRAEEWAAIIDARPSQLLKLLTALGFTLYAFRALALRTVRALPRQIANILARRIATAHRLTGIVVEFGSNLPGRVRQVIRGNGVIQPDLPATGSVRRAEQLIAALAQSLEQERAHVGWLAREIAESEPAKAAQLSWVWGSGSELWRPLELVRELDRELAWARELSPSVELPWDVTRVLRQAGSLPHELDLLRWRRLALASDLKPELDCAWRRYQETVTEFAGSRDHAERSDRPMASATPRTRPATGSALPQETRSARRGWRGVAANARRQADWILLAVVILEVAALLILAISGKPSPAKSPSSVLAVVLGILVLAAIPPFPHAHRMHGMRSNFDRSQPRRMTSIVGPPDTAQRIGRLGPGSLVPHPSTNSRSGASGPAWRKRTQ